MKFLKIMASRGVAGISDCIIIATLILLFWFLFMSESQIKYAWALVSCLGFVAAYFVYRIADKLHDSF